ncbi:hypothetical protein Sliba_11310 [Streptomyces nigrescens]|uniref:Uncharacterized protein n=1 Tax=Streptomyces nigrescens TaxID=1920 RepID=A0A640TBF6_STRNI|nr:hypothetical protein Sliba_11310 [Streptomyces libani subsp. libani]GGV87774.1 hypothetical protein GCM10010500_08720 [Streptomyces libani subsp. libani]
MGAGRSLAAGQGAPVPYPGRRTPDAGRRTPDAGRRTQGAGRKLLADLQVVLYGIPYVLDNDIPWGHNIRPGNRGWARA